MNAQQIKATINQLSDEDKAQLKDELILRRGISLLMGKKVNHRILDYTLSILNGEEPEPLTHSHRRVLNSKVKVIQPAG